jgi:hypothetical protein
VHSIAVSLFAKKDQIHFFNEIGYRHNPYQHCPQGDVHKAGKCRCEQKENFDYDGFVPVFHHSHTWFLKHSLTGILAPLDMTAYFTPRLRERSFRDSRGRDSSHLWGCTTNSQQPLDYLIEVCVQMDYVSLSGSSAVPHVYVAIYPTPSH